MAKQEEINNKVQARFEARVDELEAKHDEQIAFTTNEIASSHLWTFVYNLPGQPCYRKPSYRS